MQQSSETERQILEREISSVKFAQDDLFEKHAIVQQEIIILKLSVPWLEEKLVHVNSVLRGQTDAKRNDWAKMIEQNKQKMKFLCLPKSLEVKMRKEMFWLVTIEIFDRR